MVWLPCIRSSYATVRLRIYYCAHIYLFISVPHKKAYLEPLEMLCLRVPLYLVPLWKGLADWSLTGCQQAPAIRHLCLRQLGLQVCTATRPLTWLLEIRILGLLHIQHSYPLSHFLSPRIQTLTVSSKVTCNSTLIVSLRKYTYHYLRVMGLIKESWGRCFLIKEI